MLKHKIDDFRHLIVSTDHRDFQRPTGQRFVKLELKA